ncbi:MAG: cysteine hydrolase [Spirochaetes bacterium]|nr:cysteine hydrolase [Spirochaetota bacterium]
MIDSPESINPENTAFLLIEFQKTWTEKSFLHRLIRKEYVSKNVLKNTINLINRARTNGFPVIHAPLILNKEDKERYKKIPFPPKLLKGFTAGTWKAEFTEGVYDKKDLVVEGRYSFDACEGSNLEQLLKESGIKNIFFCGFTTDQCVGLTMKTLTLKGYNCFLVPDCTASRNNRLQRKAEERNKTITSADIIKLPGFTAK